MELRIVLGAPVAADLTVNLRSSHPLAATLPESVAHFPLSARAAPHATLKPDGFVVVTFDADPAVRYGVLDLTELPGGLYDGITAEISNSVGRFTFPVTNQQHYFFVMQLPK